MDLRDYQQSANNYDQLSLRDLLDARDLYHVHLMQHPHVIATAVGRYRIRIGDAWPNAAHQHNERGKRTLANSEVRPYSWPCVLAFVDEWVDEKHFGEGARYDPDQIVPRTLYLPDGRRVPVCVVEAPREARTDIAAPEAMAFPVNNIGNGFPVLARVQEQERAATIACLVSDGHRTYALTNRHVTGSEGEILRSRLNGKEVEIGVTAPAQCDRLAFAEVYDGWPGKKVYVNVDAGLIDVDTLDIWTAKLRTGEVMGPLVDLSADNLTLSLIGCRVRGFGAASGLMQGELQALFYRYKSLGGFEYVADFLIGPRSTQNMEQEKGRGKEKPGALSSTFRTRAGDSGTLWLLEPLQANGDDKGDDKKNRHGTRDHDDDGDAHSFRPLAMQWGANLLGWDSKRGSRSFALATCLSTICRELGVDIVRDWNLDQVDTWGAVGHFAIASRTITRLSGNFPKLSKLMQANLTIISHDDATILKSDFKNMGDAPFVPLADVPDFYWKHGKQGFSRFYEGPNHFADMDHYSDVYKADLLTLCKDPANIDAPVWDKFYDSITEIIDGSKIDEKYRGLLPFRVWQIFDAMVGYAKSGDADRFVCAAGVLTHYVGDACQPLHISYLHDGDPRKPVTRTVNHRDGTSGKVTNPLGMGVHAAYEDDMVNTNRPKILAGIDKTKVPGNDRVANGQGAAQRVVELMQNTFETIPPENIVDAFLKHPQKSGRPEMFWTLFGDKTIQVMQDGIHLASLLWESAWAAGGGEQNIKATKALTEDGAMKICGDKDFVPSMSVAQIGAVLQKA